MVKALSYTHGASDVGLLGEPIAENLSATASRIPHGEALVDVPSGRRWTYSELVAWSRSIARGLLAQGVGKGDRVGIWSPNGPEWVAVQYATAFIGAILVNINPAYRTSELEFVLRHSGIRTLVSAALSKTTDYRSMVNEVASRVDTLVDVIYIGDATWDRLEAVSSSVSDAELDLVAAALSFDDPINIQYTSGTTGFPKGATLSHHNILNNGFFIGEGCRYTEADRVCIPVPFYHCFGMVLGNLACTTHGSAIVIPSPGFDPSASLR